MSAQVLKFRIGRYLRSTPYSPNGSDSPTCKTPIGYFLLDRFTDGFVGLRQTPDHLFHSREGARVATTSTRSSITGWPINIVRYDIKPAKDFLAHPLNFRIHPQAQQRATKGSLDTLGWIDEVMVNLRTSADWEPGDRGVETMINGHLRVQLALREGEETPVPVKYVDLSPNDELTALGIFDELAAMVVKDKEKLGQVMQGAKPQDAAVAEMLANMAQQEGITPPDFQPVGIEEQGRLDEKAKVECPECGCVFEPKA